jgi:hypothetical protein
LSYAVAYAYADCDTHTDGYSDSKPYTVAGADFHAYA